MIYNMPLSNFVHFNYIYSNILIFYPIRVDVIFYCFYQMFLFCIVYCLYWFSKSIICSGFYFYKYPFFILFCYNIYFSLSCIKVSIYNFISICFYIFFCNVLSLFSYLFFKVNNASPRLSFL